MKPKMMMTTSLRTVLAFRLRGLTLIWIAAGVQFLRQSDPLWAAAFLTFEDGLLPVLVMWVLGVAFTAVNLRTVTVPACMAWGTFAMGFNASRIADSHNGPSPVEIIVRSVTHSGFGTLAVKPRSTRSGTRAALGSRRVKPLAPRAEPRDVGLLHQVLDPLTAHGAQSWRMPSAGGHRVGGCPDRARNFRAAMFVSADDRDIAWGGEGSCTA